MKTLRQAFTYRDAVLHCDAVPLPQLGEKFGTPLYVYSASFIRERYQVFDRAFGRAPHTVCYSVKANSNLSLLKLLAKLGCGFDVVSGGELERVLRAHRRAAQRVVFSGVGKTAAEIDLALRSGILMFNVESAAELAALAERTARLKKTARIALRVNPDVAADTHPYISTGLHQHKFGVPFDEARALYRCAAAEKYLDVAGVSAHIGSQILDVSAFTDAVSRLAALIRELRAARLNIRYLDAGGGLGISYHHDDMTGRSAASNSAAAAAAAHLRPEDFPSRAQNYARAILEPLRGLKLHLLLEPGRAIVGPAGALLTRVVYHKRNNSKQFLVVDAAMNDLIRPSLYGAYHEIVKVNTSDTTPNVKDCHPERSEGSAFVLSSRAERSGVERPCVSSASSASSAVKTCEHYDIVGPICETGDFFARDRELPPTAEGDLLAVLDTGAYGMAIASNYNTRPRAAEVLVDGRSVRLIRRRETVSDLLRPEL